jgi:flagellar hook-length control protein FliK
MNATPTNLSPSQAVQVQNTAGKSQDSATPDTPFSQVLSSEIAQNRNSSQAKQDADSPTAPDAAAPQTERPAEAAAESASDPLDLVPEQVGPVDPKTLLALAINPDLLDRAPAGTVAIETEQATEQDAIALPFQSARKGRALLSAQAGQATDPTQGAAKADPALSGKAALQAATANANAVATAFSGQLTEASLAKGMKGSESLSDLISNPAMRPASHGPLENLHTQNEIAAPRLAPAVGSTAWGQALGDKIVWMATAAQQTATLTLNPPDMGPLQIVLNISNEQATASFFSAQPEVRQALEAAFPRLKDMMNEAGIQLGQATVSAETPQQDNTANRQEHRGAPGFPGADDPAAIHLQTVPMPVQQSGRGLIDMFA